MKDPKGKNHFGKHEFKDHLADLAIHAKTILKCGLDIGSDMQMV
jgi:hypothetical protein